MRSLYIDGAWRDSASSEALDVVDPATEQVIDTVPAGAAADAEIGIMGETSGEREGRGAARATPR